MATFRSDAQYSDGRHPDAVTFSTARDDAQRRDFTINGLFFDPEQAAVIDYVGGQQDLAAGIVRAIGEPIARFSEDKLRLLRAVRFAAALDFEIDPATRQAIEAMADQIHVVSAERIAAELRLILTHANRRRGIWLLVETGLLAAIWPELAPARPAGGGPPELAAPWPETLATLAALEDPGFPLALAALVHRLGDARSVAVIAERLKLAGSETDRAGWLVAHCARLTWRARSAGPRCSDC